MCVGLTTLFLNALLSYEVIIIGYDDYGDYE